MRVVFHGTGSQRALRRVRRVRTGITIAIEIDKVRIDEFGIGSPRCRHRAETNEAEQTVKAGRNGEDGT